MAEAIGEPVTDPHGAPIPTREGTIDETPHPSLADAEVGSRNRIVRVGDEDPGMLRYLDSLGLRPGVEVTLTNRAPFGGPLTIEVGSTTQQVGAALASRVLVAATAD